MSTPLLSIQNLAIELPIGRTGQRIIHNVSLDIQNGDIMGLVGESGCGKSVTAMSLLQLLPTGRDAITAGAILLNGEDITRKTPEEMRKIRGKDISMIFQEPMTCLNPVLSIGTQLTDVIRAHQSISKQKAKQLALRKLEDVQMPDPPRVFSAYPHELSGGQRQRVMIAAALSCSPKLLIADEPTTALDVTIQKQILTLLKNLVEKNHASILFISHDLGVISEICNKVAVMYAGVIVESGFEEDVLEHPLHPYTQALLQSLPTFKTVPGSLSSISGNVPAPGTPITGCRFHDRCPQCQKICTLERPTFVGDNLEHQARCHLLNKGAETNDSSN